MLIVFEKACTSSSQLLTRYPGTGGPSQPPTNPPTKIKEEYHREPEKERERDHTPSNTKFYSGERGQGREVDYRGSEDIETEVSTYELSTRSFIYWPYHLSERLG
jgi:hypothetical protein